jgi:RNA polymerase sigma-70 factor (ECF subfamily)
VQRQLVEQAMRGDHDAFTKLTRQTARGLLVVATLILHDPGLAEDATQEALVSAWRHIHALRDPDRFDAWLRRLLVNACRQEARRAGRRRQRELHVDGIELPALDATRSLDDRDELERGFRRLDLDQRAVLVLVHFAGLQIHEAAEALGIPSGTARSRLYRATQAMRAALEADAREGSPA